jgi:hypothetical protein
MNRVAFIVYEPPDWGQSLRASPATAWERVQRFLQSCTDADPDRPFLPTLTIFEPASPAQAQWYDQAVLIAEDRFGRGQRRVWAQEVRADFSVRSRKYCVEWRLAPEQASDARSYLIAAEPWPRSEVGPAQLSLSYTFRLLDPETRAVLPGQAAEFRAHSVQATSDLTVVLQRLSWATMNARFPFPEADDEFLAYVARIAPMTPVPLLSNKFRHWVPTKRPSYLGYVRRKVTEGNLAKVLR